MGFDVNHKLYNLQESKELYFLFTGLSYSEIAEKYYFRNKNKFVYKIRKLMKELNLQNRRQLAFFAYKNQLIQIDKIRE